MISPELNAKQVKNMKNKEFIFYAHGQIPVMHFKGRFHDRFLTDEKGYTFPLLTAELHGASQRRAFENSVSKKSAEGSLGLAPGFLLREEFLQRHRAPRRDFGIPGLQKRCPRAAL